MNSEVAEDSADSILSGGKAISPKQAAHCILEFKRTTQFLRGVYSAINELKKRFPEERLDIVYAGCGPFGTLIAPLLTLFEPTELGITFIDFHARSLESLRDCLQKSGLEAFADNFVQTDATHYRHPKSPHLVLTETMQAALEKETQTAVTRNLAPQLIANGVFIPQKITVEACLTNLHNETFEPEAEKDRIYLGKLLTLDAESLRVAELDLRPVEIEIPAVETSKLDFVLMTKVFVFEDFILRERESSITNPVLLRDLQTVQGGEKLEFRYISDNNPRFEFHRADNVQA